MEKIVTRGRPREFDVDEALAAALGVFWRKGYEATSLTDLTEAMGITRPSLYAAFGNKEALFRQTLDLYEREKMAYAQQALEAPSARGVAERLLTGAVDLLTSPGCRGCLGVIASVSCVDPGSTIREMLLDRADSVRLAFITRMQRAIDEGDFHQPVDAEGMTLYLIAMMQGLSVQASAGATPEQLQQVVEATLAIWPSR